MLKSGYTADHNAGILKRVSVQNIRKIQSKVTVFCASFTSSKLLIEIWVCTSTLLFVMYPSKRCGSMEFLMHLASVIVESSDQFNKLIGIN